MKTRQWQSMRWFTWTALILVALIGGCQDRSTPNPTPAPSSAPVSPGISLYEIEQQQIEAMRREYELHRPPPPPLDARTPMQLAQAACSAANGSWRCPRTPQPKAMAATTTPIIPFTWTIPAWFVDPANVSTTASDFNDCTTSATACLTWQEIAVHRLGTISPRLRQNTQVTFLSSQSTTTDPVYFTPYMEAGAVVSLVGSIGASQQVATGTITVTAAKNRNTPQLLNATLPAGGAIGQLIVNATHPSRAWIYKNIAGNTWAISQPLTPTAIPVTTTAPAEVDTWTTGDTVTMYNPVSINIAQIGPKVTNFNGALNNLFVVNSLKIASTASDPLDIVGNGTAVDFTECAFDKIIEGNIVAPIGVAFINSDNSANVFLRGPGNPSQVTGLYGGQFRGTITVTGASLSVSGDIILAGGLFVIGTSSYGSVYIETGKTFTFGGNGTQVATGGGPILWGPGTMNVQGESRVTYPAGAGNAAATFKQTGGLQLNGGTTAHSIFTAANVDTPCGGINLTPANLDTAASATCATTGFGGLAFQYGGGSITNQSP